MEIKSWYRRTDGGVCVHQCFGLDQTGIAKHGFSTRSGGVSPPPYDSLNLSLNVGDDAQAVIENRRRFGKALGLDAANLVSADQPHGNSVAVVGREDIGKGAVEFSTAISGVDALLTKVQGPVLALHYADCVPVFLIDPANKAVGVVHAGWKGTIVDVSGAAVRGMMAAFGSNPADLLAAIGPAIGRCCFDVQPDVAAQLLAASGGDMRIVTGGTGALRADVKLVNYLQLRRVGLVGPNIFVSQECTCCNSAEFYSYRRENTTGRMSAWIALV